MYYVKTNYIPSSYRLPNISKFRTDKEVAIHISTCLKWGIGILSCKIIPKETANRLLSKGKAEV